MHIVLPCGLLALWDQLNGYAPGGIGNGKFCPLTGTPLSLDAVERTTFGDRNLKENAVNLAKGFEACRDAGVNLVQYTDTPDELSLFAGSGLKLRTEFTKRLALMEAERLAEAAGVAADKARKVAEALNAPAPE